MTAYGVLLRLYPRAFREEYGEDMALLLAHQLRDEPALRVWGRTVLDVALTVPPLRLEAHMSRSSSAPVVYGTAGVVSAVVAGVAGSAVGISVIGLAGVLLFGSLAVIAWRRAHSLGDASFATAHWWKFLAAGAVLLAGIITLDQLAGDSGSGNGWMLFMGVLLTAVVLMAVGLVLGVTQLAARRSHAS